ncbi:hypothetical protein THASP1DRAFT_26607, partial [Thamnocephalis sphaerospora]
MATPSEGAPSALLSGTDETAAQRACIVYMEKLPAGWQTAQSVETALVAAFGAAAVSAVELPQNERGRARGWCFVRFCDSAHARQLLQLNEKHGQSQPHCNEASMAQQNTSLEMASKLKHLRAAVSGVRILSKQDWLRLKDEYIQRRNRLYAQRQQPPAGSAWQKGA